MDLRFMAIVMAIAIIMDILGRRMRKRAGEQQPQQPAEEGWNVLQALADAEELPDKLLREGLPPARTRPQAREELDPEQVARLDVPGLEPSVPRFDPIAWPERVEMERAIPEPAAPDPIAADPIASVPAAVPAAMPAELEPWEPPPRDRKARPIEVRSRAPRTVVRESQIADPSPKTGRTPHPPGVDAGLLPRRRSSDVAGRLGLTDARALRRIVVAREVLGPPLALRDDEGGAAGHRS